ncbi:MAG: AAA family ATPase [Myxococcales bacterium]|nr:AAA family ATPase [Myxococcales bacterium]
MKEINPSPCYIREFSLENVRCFGPRQSIDFCDAEGRWARWTVILGDNGVGKTTLLQCLWLMSPVALASESGVTPATTSRSLYRFKQWPGDPSHNLVEALARDGKHCDLAIVIGYGNSTESDFGISWRLDDPNIDWQLPFEQSASMVCIAYGASRKPSSGQVAAQADWDAATLFEEGKFLTDAEEWFLRSDYAAKADDSGRMTRQHGQVRDLLLELLGVEDLRVTGLDQRVAKPRLEAKNKAGAWLPVRSFSLGYRTSIAWIVDFALRLFERYPDSENPLQEPAVCLVDEIDLHLHPRWQRQLIAFLSRQFPRTQFIVTAHSPLVVQATEAAGTKLVVLRYDEAQGHVIIDDEVESVRGWRIDQILTSELFGLEGPHSEAVNALYRRRAELVMVGELDNEQRAELVRIDAELDQLPAGDSPQQRHAWDVLQRVAAQIENREDPGE